MTRTRPTQADLDLMLSGKRGEVKDLVYRHVAGILPAADFGREMRELLIRGHAMAGYLGRCRAGDFAPYDADDTEFGRMLADDQAPFLAGFVADLDSVRYEGEDGRPLALPILRRASMYVDRMKGSANEAFGLASDPRALLYWRLGATEESCTGCPAIAAGSPYTADTIPAWPADASQPCRVNCRCRVVRGDGVSGFS